MCWVHTLYRVPSRYIAILSLSNCVTGSDAHGSTETTEAAAWKDNHDVTHVPFPFDGTELDFWLGEWDCTWDDGRGSNMIDRDFDAKVIHERFTAEPDADGTGGLRGESWSVFSTRRALWRQTWVDDQGSYLDLVGEHVDDCFAFVRSAPELGQDGHQRMVFRDVTADAFRWTWESSDDGGTTWTTRWEIAYRRRRSAAPTPA
jgi:hypothetical protein